MTAYIILIALCMFTDFICRSRSGQVVRRTMLALCCLVIVVLTGFRYEVGADYEHYLEVFDYINSPYIERDYEEIGYRILNKAVDAAGWDARAIFIISGILLGAALYIFVSRIVPQYSWGFFMFLFVCGGTFFSSLNLMRQYMALSCCLVAYVLWERRHPVWAVLLLAIGVSFHRSVLVVLLLFPIRFFLRRNRDMTILVMYIVGFAVLIFGMDSIIGTIARIVPSWSGYANVDTNESRNTMALLKAVVPNVLLFYGLSKSRTLLPNSELTVDMNDQHHLQRSLMLTGAITFATMSICFAGVMILTRLTEFFAPLYYVYLCRLVQDENREMKPLLNYAIYLYYLALTVVTIFIMNSNDVVPYQMAWNVW